MTVYRYFMKMIINYKWVIISYVGVFLLFGVINSSSDSKEASFVETKFNLGIIDNSDSELGKSLREYLEKNNNSIETLEDEEYIKEQIFLEIVDAVIIIPKDFDHLVRIEKEFMMVYNDDRKIESIQIQSQINKFILFANAVYENGEFNIKLLSKALEKEAKVTVIGSGVKSQGVNQWFMYYYNFSAYIIIAIYIAVIGLVMNDFANDNINKRIQVSSKKTFGFNLQLYLAQLSIGMIITSLFILISMIMKAPYLADIYLAKYIINIFVFSFSILCLTFLINNITSSSFVKNGLSTVLSLGTSFISGVMLPQDLLSPKVLSIAKFFPSYYFVKINNSDIHSISDVSYEIFMQLLFAIVFLLLGLYFSRRSGERSFFRHGE